MDLKIIIYILLFVFIMIYYYILRNDEKDLKISFNFENNGIIPLKYTADGDNLSPPIIFENISEKAESIVIIMDDMSTSDELTHWLIWNISPDIEELPEGITAGEIVKELDGACQGKNDFGDVGYKGPVANNHDHIYRFRLFTLDDKLNISTDIDKKEIEERMIGSILQRGEILAKYGG